MSVIKINFEGINQNADYLLGAISNYEDLMSKLDQQREKVKVSWEGSAAENWEQLMRRYQSQGNKFIDVIREFTDYAKTVSNTFNTLDQQCASSIRNSF